MSQAREGLIIQLIQIEGGAGDMNYISGVADFILHREKQMLDEIENALDFSGDIDDGFLRAKEVINDQPHRLALLETIQPIKQEGHETRLEEGSGEV